MSLNETSENIELKGQISLLDAPNSLFIQFLKTVLDVITHQSVIVRLFTLFMGHTFNSCHIVHGPHVCN